MWAYLLMILSKPRDSTSSASRIFSSGNVLCSALRDSSVVERDDGVEEEFDLVLIPPVSRWCLTGEVVACVIPRPCRCPYDASFIVLSSAWVWYAHRVVRKPPLCGLDAGSEIESYPLESSHQATRKLSITYASAGLCGIAICTNALVANV